MTLQEAIVAKNLTYRDVAKLIDATPEYVQMLATGKRDHASYKIMRKLSALTGEPIEELFPDY